VDLQRRVFYTLHDEQLQTHRNSKAIAVLLNYLHEQGVLSDTAIDDILLEVVDMKAE
jgi:hypothetical protein